MIRNVVIIGAGNLATQLAKALTKNGINICEIYSRTKESAITLSSIVNCDYTTDIASIVKNADLYILATSDNAHKSILEQLSFKPIRLVHTAGSIPLNILDGYAEQTGVFYPFQTFSKKRDVSFTQIPILVESESLELLEDLKHLGLKLSERVEEMSSDKRKYLHVSAVFACNFVNHLYDLGHELTESADIDFSLLIPLIEETAEKIKTISPREAQTGPAVRMDKNILSQQEELLNKKCPDLVEIYKQLSQSIYNYANK